MTNSMGAQLDLVLRPTAEQPVAIHGVDKEKDNPIQPVIVMIHGTFRRAAVMAAWPGRAVETRLFYFRSGNESP